MASPAVTYDTTTYPTLGYVRLTWTNATAGSDFYAYRVYRRLSGGSWVLIKEYLNNTANYDFHDYTAPSNQAIEYAVTRAYLVGAVVNEEAKSASATFTPSSDNYWLIHPFDESKTFLLYHVTSDSFDDETEMEVLEIVGRGRKVDQGTAWGVQGSISCQLRDRSSGPTARAQLQSLRSAKASQTYFWLRNPWGDVWRVALGDIGVDRVAGVGPVREFVDIDFDYTQIAP